MTRRHPEDTPDFSIVTCTRNSAATLAQTIDSVRSQRGVRTEQIFVDGCSTDETLDIIARMAPEARVLRNVTGGISRAMNAGIAFATGSVVAHLHSDDYYVQDDVLQRVLGALSSNPAARWAVGRIRVLSNGTFQDQIRVTLPPTLFNYAAGRIAVPHPATFVRREAFEQVGFFDERLRYSMDTDMWLRLWSHGNPLMIDATLAVFRKHAGSASTANSVMARREEWTVRRSYFRQAPAAVAMFWLRHLRRMRRELRAKR